MIEMYVQRYIPLNKGHRLLFRLTYYCNPEKSRKANFVEILTPKHVEEGACWGYGDEGYTVIYKNYNGLHELEQTAKRLTQMANVVRVVTHRDI